MVCVVVHKDRPGAKSRQVWQQNLRYSHVLLSRPNSPLVSSYRPPSVWLLHAPGVTQREPVVIVCLHNADPVGPVCEPEELVPGARESAMVDLGTTQGSL